MHKFLASLPRIYKIGIMLISDVVLLPLALWTAIALRYGSFNPDIDSYLWLFLVVPIFTVPIFIRLGLYRAVIRYVDVQVITTVFYGVTLSVLVMIAIVAMTQVKGLPRTSLVIYWVIAIIYIVVSCYFAKVIL